MSPSAADTLDRIVGEMKARLNEIRPQADALMEEVAKLEGAIMALEASTPEPTPTPYRGRGNSGAKRQPVKREVRWDDEAKDAYVVNADTGERVRGRIKDDERMEIEQLKAEHAV